MTDQEVLKKDLNPSGSGGTTSGRADLFSIAESKGLKKDLTVLFEGVDAAAATAGSTKEDKQAFDERVRILLTYPKLKSGTVGDVLQSVTSNFRQWSEGSGTENPNGNVLMQIVGKKIPLMTQLLRYSTSVGSTENFSREGVLSLASQKKLRTEVEDLLLQFDTMMGKGRCPPDKAAAYNALHKEAMRDGTVPNEERLCKEIGQALMGSKKSAQRFIYQKTEFFKRWFRDHDEVVVEGEGNAVDILNRTSQEFAVVVQGALELNSRIDGFTGRGDQGKKDDLKRGLTTEVSIMKEMLGQQGHVPTHEVDAVRSHLVKLGFDQFKGK